MIHIMDCKARVNAQDPDYPTFKSMDCIGHCNANASWHGRIMDCEATIVTLIVSACRSWDQGVRLVVTINDIDVSEALIGNLNIQHNKNMISTFSLNLGNTTYSPRTNANIDLEKVIVITAYINGQDKKLFTGLLDEPSAENIPAFRVIVTGRDYGKKLLDKITTVVSVQDLADSTKRNDLIKYLASLAGQTDVDIPEMDEVTIDNSFQDQSIWDMIRKEAMVEQYWVGHNEDGKLELKLDEIKSDKTLYPTPDWTYEEDRIIRVGYKKGRININKIIVLGKTTERRVPVTSSYDNILVISKSWAEGAATVWDENRDDYNIKYTVNQNKPWYETGSIKVTRTGAATHAVMSFSTQGVFTVVGRVYWNRRWQYYLFQTHRSKVSMNGNLGVAGINLNFKGATQSTTYETRYDQISAKVTDPNSIEKYGERDGGSVEYPLLETVEQCTAVGAKIIRDDHSKLGQTYFLVPLNPLIKVGCTIGIIGKDIGLNERYYIKEVALNFDINGGKIKARTQVGGVLYV